MNKKLNITAGTIVRTVVLALALVNQVLASTGHAVIDIDEGTLTQLANAGFTIIAAVVAWWKNNSYTQAALQGDVVMNELKEEGR